MINLGFLTEGKTLLLYSSYLPLGVPNWTVKRYTTASISWSRFAEDHDLHQGFFMTFDFHVGTSKFDVRIYDGTQCQKEYEAEV
jgi:hypothetical protein